MRFIGFVVFVVLQIAMLPLTVMGLGVAAYRQLYLSKKLGLSQTAIEVLQGRWAMDVFGIREDPATRALARVLPNASPFGLWTFLLPLWLKHKIDGGLFLYPRIPDEGRETMAELIVVRSLHIDRMIERALPEAKQLVLLGAGYDTRAYGSLPSDGVRFFEVDQASVQEHKRANLEKAGIDASRVTFVTVDFAVDDGFEKLSEAGYDPHAPTIFLWEGVTLYLQEDDVRRTLQGVRANSAPGSVVVADFYAERFIAFANKSYNRKALEMTGEGLAFGLPFATGWESVLAEFVRSEGLELGEARFMGSANRKGPFMVVAELIVGRGA